MYRIVFGMSEVKGLEDNDFKFISSKSRAWVPAKDPAGAPENDTAAELDTRKNSDNTAL